MSDTTTRHGSREIREERDHDPIVCEKGRTGRKPINSSDSQGRINALFSLSISPGMKNKRRKINIQKEIQELRECFGDVKRFTDVHYRIRGELDIWPTTGRFYGIKTRMKGFYNTKLDLMDQIEYSEKVETPLQQTNAECEAQRLLFRDF